MDTVVKKLLDIKQIKGFLTEDDILDYCIRNHVELSDIEIICEQVISEGNIIEKVVKDKKDDTIKDRARLNYDKIFSEILSLYPGFQQVISYMKNVTPPQVNEIRTLLISAQQGNSRAKSRIIDMYMRTVAKQAFEHYKAYGGDFEEIFDTGIIGLEIAIEKYDTSSNDLFSSYFPLWVRQNIWRNYDVENIPYVLPYHFKERVFSALNRLRKSNLDIDKYLIIFPEIKRELEEILNLERKDINNILESLCPCIQYNDYKYTYESDRNPFISGYELVHFICLKQILNKGLSQYKEKQINIIKLRFGLDNNNPKTLEEIGVLYSISRERVRQIISKMLILLENNSVIKEAKSYLEIHFNENIEGKINDEYKSLIGKL